VRTQVQRIAHRVSARSNLDSAAAERRDVVHRGLQRAVVRADQIRVRLADGDARLLLHRGMHSLRELPFVNRGREVFGGSGGEPWEDQEKGGEQVNPGKACLLSCGLPGLQENEEVK